MKTILTISLLVFSSFGILSAQTKLIAHKSHSGSLSDFKTALEDNLFDIHTSNFGAAPIRIIETARLDSLIYLADSAAVMVTSDLCIERRRKYESIWKAGRDTVYFHPLFCLQHEKDSIKKILDETYNFKNPADSVVFIGYDNVDPLKEVTPDYLDPKIEPIVVEPINKSTKKQLRKTKRALKRQKKKEEKAKRKLEKKLNKTIEKNPEINPAGIVPIKPNIPNDPPGFSILKIALISIVALLAFIVGILKAGVTGKEIGTQK